MIKIYFILSLFLSLVACSSAPPAPLQSRQPAHNFRLSAVATQTTSNDTLCPDVAAGATCLVTWDQAVHFCKSQNAHLPTAREYANLLKENKVKVLEKNQVQGKPPEGYYLVDCKNDDGTVDAFYMNHNGYQRPAGSLENHRLWTASSPPNHLEYAHVYYDEWGGGGGNPQDHLKDHRNAFQCISNL